MRQFARRELDLDTEVNLMNIDYNRHKPEKLRSMCLLRDTYTTIYLDDSLIDPTAALDTMLGENRRHIELPFLAEMKSLVRISMINCRINAVPTEVLALKGLQVHRFLTAAPGFG